MIENTLWMTYFEYLPIELKQAEEEGKNVFHQKQAGGPLDIVDDPSSLGHHPRHGGKIRVQQHQAA